MYFLGDWAMSQTSLSLSFPCLRNGDNSFPGVAVRVKSGNNTELGEKEGPGNGNFFFPYSYFLFCFVCACVYVCMFMHVGTHREHVWKERLTSGAFLNLS